jgi:hypothetical protein
VRKKLSSDDERRHVPLGRQWSLLVVPVVLLDALVALLTA